MLHIKPIHENDASEKVKIVFQDIKYTLKSDVVPLFFRYLANYEEYFLYSWDKIKANIESSYFQDSVKDIHEFSLEHVIDIYSPSRSITRFLGDLRPEEKMQLHETVSKLIVLNIQLMLLTIGIREGVKGVQLSQQELPHMITRHEKEEVFEVFAKTSGEEKDMAAASKMLAPLFGSQAIMISHYPDFFAHIAHEMGDLIKTEAYLQKRVELEHKGLKKITEFTYPLGCSYAEIAYFAAGQPYFSELLYILAETFPSQFPRLVFTSEVMHIVLSPKSSLATL